MARTFQKAVLAKGPDTSTWSFEQIAEALLAAPFQFAKTMPDQPHSYVLRQKWSSSVPFDVVVQYIRDHGYQRRYGRATYTYLDINGQKFWSMGAPVHETILINRATIERAPAAYDKVAAEYDSLYTDTTYRQEEADVFSFLPKCPDSVLDIGCGSGMALDYVTPRVYVGVDPSRAMLDVLALRCRGLAGARRVHSAFESFHLPERFSLVLCLFGVASYIRPDHLPRLLRYVAPDGHFAVMAYREGYQPKTHADGPLLPVYTHDLSTLPGESHYIGEGHVLRVGRMEA